MKLKDVDIIFINANNFFYYMMESKGIDYIKNDKAHSWQFRWHKKIKSSSICEAEWDKAPINEQIVRQIYNNWVDKIIERIRQSTKPVIIVAHSYGVSAAISAFPKLQDEIKQKIIGGFFVAPAEFTDVKYEKLSFPSFLIASSDDIITEQKRSKEIAKSLNSFFLDAGSSGHINEESGHGPWPEGLLVFSQFMNKIQQ